MYEYSHGGNAAFEAGASGCLDLSANINPLGLPPAVAEAVAAAIGASEQYPDSSSAQLCAAIATFEGVAPEWVFAANGASDIIFRLPRAVAARKVMVTAPTFSDYERAAASFGAEVYRHQLAGQDGFKLTRAILDDIERERPDLVFICNPNNPTGQLADAALLAELADQTRQAGICLVLDECFLDFVDKNTPSAKRWLADHPRLVVLKAFTKLFAMPGIRLGYSLCSDDGLNQSLRFHGPDWPVSNLAQAAGLAALEGAEGYIEATRQFVARERQRIESALADHGYQVFESAANYVFFSSPYPFDLREELDRLGIRIRCCANYHNLGKGYYRIAVSSEENNTRLLEALAALRTGDGSVSAAVTGDGGEIGDETGDGTVSETGDGTVSAAVAGGAAGGVLAGFAPPDRTPPAAPVPAASRYRGSLRKGFTTGLAAAAAAKAATLTLLGGQPVRQVAVQPRLGEPLVLDVAHATLEADAASCGIVKDAGDDPDVTHGCTVYARVSRIIQGIEVDGGQGIGRVTKPGLKVQVGLAAINPVPMQMIREAISEACLLAGYEDGIKAVISIPDGAELAKRTMNERLGVVGGLSILGTTGIVEPMSDQALIDTIKAEIDVVVASQESRQACLLMMPGNYGRDFAREQLGLDTTEAVRFSNFIGEALDHAVWRGVGRITLVGHAGKLVKLAGGIMNTYHRQADCRLEIIATHAALAGASRQTIEGLMGCVTTEAAIDLLAAAGICEPTWQGIGQRIAFYLAQRTGRAIDIDFTVFTQEHGVLVQGEVRREEQA